MADRLIDYSLRDGVAVLTLDSPHNRNALSTRLRGELRDLLLTVREDEAVRVVLLSHTGPVFCSGMDLKESRGGTADQQGVRELPELMELVASCPKPVVVRAAGPARAGGVGLLASADIVVAASTATFAFTEVRLGLVPAVISVPLLRRMAATAVSELLLTGETFGADRAAALGLVNSAVPEADLDDEVARYLDMLGRGAPGALTATKALLRETTARQVPADYPALLTLSAGHFAGPEGQEGMRAFAEKRPPAWVPTPTR
ncbi:enoyl-CoA hydratase [Actinoalloteichus sp. AHMU CJ021]|uniref:enoyl-CoA hydratase-related protein n=1 Tax=Actinoalloteichus sp. AHMU CJ021 TaxID=2072503 RepID=UPI000CA0405B|nr:enoyl-CoA hydratase [Actinoalloteichus sp. AHMU CJ021]